MVRGATTSLTPVDRRLVLGVAIAQVGLLTLTASLNYVIPAMAQDFDATSSQEAAWRQISSIASLLVVFVAGVLGSTLGERRVMLASSVIFVAGAIIMALSPSVALVSVGLLLANVGKAVLAVVALAALAARIRDADGRATAFATVSALAPVAFLVTPLIAGVLIDGPGWRWVAALWTACGIGAMAAIVFLLPRDGITSPSGEMVTPALAGVVLAAGIQAIDQATSGDSAGEAVFFAIVAGAALVALAVVYRRIPSPTLVLAPLRRGGLVLLIVVVILFSFSNLFYYTILLLQITYGYSTMQAAVLMVPAQCGAITGAVIARKLLQRFGITRTGGSMTLALAGVLGIVALIPAGVPVLVPIAMMTLYAAASVAGLVAITNAVMNMARPGEEGVTSSYKAAAGSVGGALGIALATVVVSLVGTGAMAGDLQADSEYSQQTIDASWDLLEGTQPTDVSDLVGIPLSEVDEISADEASAYDEAYRAQAAVGAVVALGAALMFLAARRRQSRDGSAAAAVD